MSHQVTLSKISKHVGLHISIRFWKIPVFLAFPGKGHIMIFGNSPWEDVLTRKDGFWFLVGPQLFF